VIHLPERAVAVLTARVKSLMIEATAVPRGAWTVQGEHDNDARRAFQIAALAVAADTERYTGVAQAAGMSAQDIQKAGDYGAEIHRGWRRILTPLWMPSGERSREARVVCDADSGIVRSQLAASLLAEIESVATRFDWHSQVTVRFAAGKGGAGWNRGQRTVTVRSDYLRRFVEQGKVAR
jgi:hypothetical protein